MARPRRNIPSNNRNIHQSTNPGQPAGLNVYFDRKGRVVYYSPLEKKAWYVPTFEFKKFNRFRSRYVIAIASLMLLVVLMKEWFNLPVWIPVVVSLGIWLGLEYGFYKFLHSLQPVKHFSKEDFTHSYEIEMTKDDRTKIYIKCALYIVLGVLLVVNGYQQNYDTMLMLFCYAAMVFCVFMAGSLLWQLSKAVSADAAEKNKPAVKNRKK